MDRTVTQNLLGLADYQPGAIVSRTLLKRNGGMPANQPHAVTARSRFKMLLIMIRNAVS